jgi:hypothetical protein
MYETMQLWRTDNDVMDDSPPLGYDDWLASMDEDTPLVDICKGWAWNAQTIGLTRQYDDEAEIYGDEAPDPPVGLTRAQFALSLSLNIDG